MCACVRVRVFLCLCVCVCYVDRGLVNCVITIAMNVLLTLVL